MLSGSLSHFLIHSLLLLVLQNLNLPFISFSHPDWPKGPNRPLLGFRLDFGTHDHPGAKGPRERGPVQIFSVCQESAWVD